MGNSVPEREGPGCCPGMGLGSTFVPGFMETEIGVFQRGLEHGKMSGKSHPTSRSPPGAGRGRDVPPHFPVGNHALLHQGLVGKKFSWTKNSGQKGKSQRWDKAMLGLGFLFPWEWCWVFAGTGLSWFSSFLSWKFQA